MKTARELQAAVDEIRLVCNKHGIVLIGTCESEGIYGEITIGAARKEDIPWHDVKDRVDNVVTDEFMLGGIGDFTE